MPQPKGKAPAPEPATRRAHTAAVPWMGGGEFLRRPAYYPGRSTQPPTASRSHQLARRTSHSSGHRQATQKHSGSKASPNAFSSVVNLSSRTAPVEEEFAGLDSLPQSAATNGQLSRPGVTPINPVNDCPVARAASPHFPQAPRYVSYLRQSTPED